MEGVRTSFDNEECISAGVPSKNRPQPAKLEEKDEQAILVRSLWKRRTGDHMRGANQ